ncbi:squalene/phytoene synthase family protein [Marivivens aquimaris]|uniref:squalene/phytoene synthase family protein n=1 Tax=Marivivens aquimaris TaxID=2774876 RepID=UPI00187E7624|nr:squalene/phytoene synthase family protein [Marivivens aquimaris]
MTLTACAELVEKGDPDRFLAAMSAPPEARERLFPLYAFNLEIAKAPWITKEPMIAQMRLQWWQDIVGEAAEGAEPRAHEVAGPLASVIQSAKLPVSVFSTMITARYWDLNGDLFTSEEDVIGHIDRSAGSLMVLTALALGASEDQEADIREAAIASGIANWFMAVPALEAAGRKPFAHGTLAEVKNIADYGLRMLDKQQSTDFGSATPALRAGWRARALLKKAIADPQAVPEGRLDTSEFRRKGSLMLKAAAGRW